MSTTSKTPNTNFDYKQDSSNESTVSYIQFKYSKEKFKTLRRISEQTVHIQNLQFPNSIPDRSQQLKVKCQKNLLQQRKSSSNSSVKKRGYDLTSSTNSHFKQMLIDVPKTFQTKRSSISSDIAQKSKPSFESMKSTNVTEQTVMGSSQKLDLDSQKPKHFNGARRQPRCNVSFVAGTSRKYLGNCPPNYDILSKMSKSRQKFFLTQDPRKVNCLVNPESLRSREYSKKNEFNALTKMVKHAQNVCVATASETSEDFICEVIDLENPLQLDFQGLDYSTTYQKDEQDLQNQRNYRRICRYNERKRVIAETQQNVEQELHEEMINIPKNFIVKDRNDVVNREPQEIPLKLGKLYRSADKPFNQNLINQEKERRRERYKNLYLNKKTKQQQKLERDNEIRKEDLANLSLTLAERNFKQKINEIEEAFKKDTEKEFNIQKLSKQRRKFPHTMREIEKFRKDLKQSNRIKRDKAKVTQQFLMQHKEKFKDFPEAQLEISSDTNEAKTNDSTLSEQSSDEMDNMTVGKQKDKFQLRGFQYKLGSQLRGKLTHKEKSKGTGREKTCITREQWLKELAPEKEKIKLDVEMGIIKQRSADDPQLVLFPPQIGFKAPKAVYSTIKDFIKKPLGHHYDRVKRKNLKLAKPRLRYTVKKFNLIKYRFGDTTKKLSQLNDPLEHNEILKLKSTSEYMEAKALLNKIHKEELKQRRLELLGIPCRPLKKSRLQTKCENSSTSSETDWVPALEDNEEVETNNSFQRTKHEVRPLRMLGNMPAPKYREPTLRQHPRKPRDYQQQRVPSEIFDQIVATTNLPFMLKMVPDKMKFANVNLKKTPYTDIFEARHHHDHWNPTQIKQVDVHYQPHTVEPKLTKIAHKTDHEVLEKFHMANPPCNQFVEMNLTLPQYDIQEMLADHYKKSNKTKFPEAKIIKTSDFCKTQDFILRTRDSKELQNLDYPGRQEYLQLIKDVRETFKEQKQLQEPLEKLYVNKQDVWKELEEDLKSIESCLTSLSSSVCTNLTNDSGSFLLMEGKEKIPLDFIRKSIVPFEELQRSRFQAEPIDVDKEQANPFQVLPFAGQKKAQLELKQAKDSFFTFNTRLKNGLRLRLEVPAEDVREKLLGMGSNKHKAQVATDIDENYVKELQNRLPIKSYKYKTSQHFIKDALRLKFESLLIQGQMVRTKIYDHLNEQHWCDMQRVKVLFEKLFAKWEKQQYDAAMAVVYRVKHVYDETDRLKGELKNLERDLTMLNMDIVFIEGHWVRCVMLQNFHYLLGEQEWRLQNDWIHRLNNGQESEDLLENFEVSILKRSTVNIRKREKDDAWAIKEYYEQVYLQNKHENLIVFANAESFQQGLENLKTKTFLILLEMNFTLSLQTELQYKLESFEEWCSKDLQERKQYVDRKCAKLYFMSDRAKYLEQRTIRYLQQPIEECFHDLAFQSDRALIAEAWRRIVPCNLRGTDEQEMFTIDMVAMMADVVMDVLAKFETIPMDLTQHIENKLRLHRAYRQKQSHQAYLIERRIDMEMKKVVRNLQSPFQRAKRPSKLPRYYLKKRIKPVKKDEKIISERAKLFFRAFHEDTEHFRETGDTDDSIIDHEHGVQEQIVPFYFDHFLKLNGYTPNYNFKTQIELRDGAEVERLKVKSVIPKVVERMEQWQELKRRVMEDNIAKNPKMYVDVMT